MEFWPTDFRADNSLLSRKRRGGKEASSSTGQALEVGSLGAVTLAPKDNHLEWKTLIQLEATAQPRQRGKSIQVLPPYRPFDPTQDEMPPQKKAIEEIEFFRTNYPDVDVPFDLLQEELYADKNVLKEFDPYQGNQIAQLSFRDKDRHGLDFICTPVGETGSELNVFPIRETSSTSTCNFIAPSTPLMKFDTPIRQLEAFSRPNIVETYSLLAVRTYGSVSLLKIDANRKRSSDHPLQAQVLRSFSSAETHDCQIMDVSCRGLGHTCRQMLLVNGTGSVFLSNKGGRLYSITSPKIDTEETPDTFWRVVWMGVSTFIRTSTKKAHLSDLRTPKATLLHLADLKECITSVEIIPPQGSFIGFSTTSRLLLFDVRHMGRPVFSIYHHRSFDRTLKLKSFNVDDTIWHTISSSRNRLVTAYNTASSLADPIHLQGMPSIFPSSMEVDLPIVGSHIFQKSSNPPGSPVSYLQLSPTGSLWSTDVVFAERNLEGGRFFDPLYNEAMEELLERSQTTASCLAGEGGLKSTEVDLSDMYKKITQVRKEEGRRENFHQVLDRLPSFWQDTDNPTDDMLTTFDIAFRSGQEPNASLRADFLTGSALNSRRGLAALLQDRLPTSQLSQASHWSFDLAALPPELVPDAAAPPRQLLDRLTEEAVSRQTTDDGIKFAIDAAQELVTDLALSRHVYAPREFSNMRKEEPNADDNLLMATQALSLNPITIPPSEFVYLQPIAADMKTKEGEDKPDDPFELLPGVRLLLSEWKVGTKPEDYVFQDWYRSASQDLSGAENDMNDQRFGLSQPQSSQMPPAVFSQPPPIASVPKVQARRGSPLFSSRSLFPFRGEGGSQMDFYMTQESVSQEQYPNTQPLPGPFGGQLNLNKKKLVKKRIGGF